MASRFVIQEPHEACNGTGHISGPGPVGDAGPCFCQDGMQRRVLTEGEYVLIEKVDTGRTLGGLIWPDWAYEVWQKWWEDESEPGATRLFDALAGGEQPSIRERAERAGIADRISDQSGYNWPPPGVDEAGGEQP